MIKKMIWAMSLCICIFVVTGCTKKQEQTLKIDSTVVTVYKDYSVDDLNGELNDPENYTYFFEGEKKFTADQGPYYKFWIKANPNLKFNEFSNGESSYMVKDLGLIIGYTFLILLAIILRIACLAFIRVSCQTKR